VIPEPFQQTSRDGNGEAENEQNVKGSPRAGTRITEKKFRPNFVVSCPSRPPHDEDSWATLTMDLRPSPITTPSPDGPCPTPTRSITFILTSPCARCSIVNVSPVTGERDRHVFQALADYRRDERSQVLFGQYLSYDSLWQQQLQSFPYDRNNPLTWQLICVESLCLIERRDQLEGQEERDRQQTWLW
jgi:hypothetical protein